MYDKSDLSTISLEWKRPSGPLNIWKVKESTSKFKDGKPIKFSIQDIPEDRYSDALDHMCSYFVRDEPTCNSIEVINDEVCLNDFRKFWTIILKQGISVGAFVEDVDNSSKPILAGLNMLFVVSKKDDVLLEQSPQLCNSVNSKKLFYTMIKLGSECDVRSIYNVDKYMAAFGLSVHPFYRGEKLGLDLLLTRDDIGRKYGIEATSTVFTAGTSQSLAARAGFQVGVEQLFQDLFDADGTVAFPKLKDQIVKVMHKKLK